MDASVAVKWLLDEPDHNRALALRADVRRSGGRFVAPPHFSTEVSSAIYKRLQQGAVDADIGARLAGRVEDLAIAPMSPPGLHRRAFEIAAQFQLKWIYDAFYVALAEIIGCDLWTADEALQSAVRDAYTNVRLLADYPL